MSTTRALAVIAISHQRASLAILEQVNLDGEGCAALAQTLLQCDGVSEAVVLSTCNRTELYLAGTEPDIAAALKALVDHTNADPDVVGAHVWHATGHSVAQHLFRVAAGLESRVAGEREILGQVRTAISVGRAAGTVGSHLDCLFRSAIAVGRRVHQTDLSSPALLPEIGLDAARPDPSKPVGLTMVMGAGLMAGETVRELVSRRMDFVVCARRVERAALLARRADQIVPFDQLPLMLLQADVVVCATGARAPLLSVADIELAMARRGGRPLVIVDLSLPRNVDPAAGRVAGVRLLDLEDLVSGSSLAELRRRTEIVEDEFRRFTSWLAGQLAGRLIARLHRGVRELCREALEDSFGDGGLDSAAITAASHSIAGRLLHAPTLTIKALVSDGDEPAALAVLASYGVTGDSEKPRSISNGRSVRLVARSGRRCGEVGRMHVRAGSAVRVAS